MTRFRFHTGDTVKAGSDPARTPVIGTVTGFSRGQNMNWYRVYARGEVYNCREDELDLVRRKQPVRRDTLSWYTPALRPEPDERCILIPKEEDGAEEEVVIGRFSPGIESYEADGFIVEHGAEAGVLFMEDVKLWAAWEWPDVKGGADHDSDPAD